MVVQADTVVNPWTVMVEPLHASVADAAVTGAVCPHGLAVGAEEHWVENFHELLEVDISARLEIARIPAQRHLVRDEHDRAEAHLRVHEPQPVLIEGEEHEDQSEFNEANENPHYDARSI